MGLNGFDPQFYVRDTNRAVYNPVMETLTQVILTRKLQYLVQINFNLAKDSVMGRGQAEVIWFKVKNNVSGQSTINHTMGSNYIVHDLNQSLGTQ